MQVENEYGSYGEDKAYVGEIRDTLRDIYGKEGYVCDTHCIRISNRLGLVDDLKDPVKIEAALRKILPRGRERCADTCTVSALVLQWHKRFSSGFCRLSGRCFMKKLTFEKKLLLAFMLCMICPTGTATPVMVNMLGGDISGVVAYTVLINVAVAVLIPLSIPLLYPSAGMSFVQSFLRIIAKVFPLLVLPCLAAWFVRYFMPAFHSWCIRNAGASFYMWAVSLMIAIIISTRALVNSGNGWLIMIEMIAFLTKRPVRCAKLRLSSAKSSSVKLFSPSKAHFLEQ